jgi:hypothetical protein
VILVFDSELFIGGRCSRSSDSALPFAFKSLNDGSAHCFRMNFPFMADFAESEHFGIIIYRSIILFAGPRTNETVVVNHGIVLAPIGK